MKISTFMILALFLGLFLNEANAQPQTQQNQFRRLMDQKFLAEYADKLEAKLKGKSVGYAFSVASRDAQFLVGRAGGDARRAPDANPRKVTADDKFNIASVSKTITAAAVLKLLNEKKISVDTPVHSYLPSNWTFGNNFKTVTFRELLTHRAGIRCDKGVTYENLKTCVAGGVNLANKATQIYDNSNFALFRMIIPRLAGYQGLILPGKADKATDEMYSKLYASQYKDYVQKNILAPIGLNGIDLKPIATNPALAYQFPNPVIAGDSFGDMTETSASRGWNMSAKQLAVFLHNLLYTEKILPKSVSEQMKTDGLGLWKKTVTGNLVNYEHGGHYPGKNDKGELWNKGEMNILALAFSNSMSVAIIVNSQFGPKQSIADAAREAMKEMLK